MATPSLVLVLMGSESDRKTMEACTEVLARLGIPHELKVISAHRQPRRLHDEVVAFEQGGGKVIVAAAGMAAHLAGTCAALTTLPVVGVPLAGGDLNGLDALLATVQMPRGIPVATVTIGSHGAINAAILAAQMLALADAEVKDKLTVYLSSHMRREF
jgi:5-(carboxyamino)imidazole ribonucleotide mutase